MTEKQALAAIAGLTLARAWVLNTKLPRERRRALALLGAAASALAYVRQR